jgi:hypothetical protein
MAVNHADGQFFLSVLFYPVAAIVGAVHGGAGWLAVFLAPASLVVGIGMCKYGRGLIYSILGTGLSRGSRIKSRWIQSIAVLPYLILYVVLPMVIAWGGVFGIWAGSVWLAKHVV